MKAKQKKITLIALMIFLKAMFAASLVYCSGLVSGSSFGARFSAGLIVGVLAIVGFTTSTVHGSRLSYNHIFGLAIGVISGLITGLIFNFMLGGTLGVVVCLIFSAEYLGNKLSEVRLDIKDFLYQIRESLF